MATPPAIKKAWWQSKTVWLNILTMVVWVFGAVTKIIPGTPLALALTAMVIPGLNLVLRIWFTSTPIG